MNKLLSAHLTKSKIKLADTDGAAAEEEDDSSAAPPAAADS
jgi:hypothetical protein